MKNTAKRLGFLSLAIISSIALADNQAATLFAAAQKLNLNPKTTAALAIDVQEDFTVNNSYKTEQKDGSLKAPNSGDEYLAKVIAFTKLMKEGGYTVIASQDNHPADHMSFASNNSQDAFTTAQKTIPTKDGGTKEITQMMWPRHCEQGTPGARILIPSTLIDHVTPKGMNPKVDSYSAFADDGGQETGLTQLLNDNNIDTIFAYGIATDYCVEYSVTHALERGKKVYVFLDLCRGIDDEGSRKAVARMKAAGAIIVTA